VDYYIVLSQRRLNSITATKAGMAADLEFAISSDERKLNGSVNWRPHYKTGKAPKEGSEARYQKRWEAAR
jgi:hypothetical protein